MEEIFLHQRGEIKDTGVKDKLDQTKKKRDQENAQTMRTKRMAKVEETKSKRRLSVAKAGSSNTANGEAPKKKTPRLELSGGVDRHKLR